MRIRTLFGIGLSAITVTFMTNLVMADAPQTSIRPKPRPEGMIFVSPRPMPRPDNIVFTSPRPMPRPACLADTSPDCVEN